MNSLFRKIQKINLIKLSTQEQIADHVANIYLRQIAAKNNSILGLATGSTPLPVYKKLIQNFENKKISFANVSTFNLDEYIGLKEEFNHESYQNFMNVNLFNSIDIDKKNTHFPSASNPKSYDKKIKNVGGIDLQILGLGINGHIAFNEPGTSLNSKTHIVNITESTRQANSRFFNNNIDLVPTHAVTMGIKTILKSKKIILIATGENKSDAIAALMSGKYCKRWPCTSLIYHKDVMVFVDEAAASKISK